jgi:protocatechuate 3,4-dioxygenase alpha subunit
VSRTPSQTVGPFFSICLTRWDQGPVADPDGVKVGGYVLDGNGDVVPDAMIETWDGEHFARVGTDDDGHWEVTTTAAPWLIVNVFARGLLNRVVTAIHFDAADVPEEVPADRRETLVAQPEGDGYRFDIVLQGEGETVFFSV